ncbi:MAG: hypothetical protein ABJG15_08185 [Hyphomonadaceae bacterium]
MLLLGKKDLRDRWIYTRQGVQNVLRRPDFPIRYLTADRGRLDAWRLDDILAYELGHPELTDEAAKAVKSRDRSRKAKTERSGKQNAKETYLGPRDLTDRWACSKHDIYFKALKSKIFPEPSFVFNSAQSRVWGLSSVEELEEKYGENPVHMGAFDRYKYSGVYWTKIQELPKTFTNYPNTVGITSDESRKLAEMKIPIADN